jgi:hypothetical protein
MPETAALAENTSPTAISIPMVEVSRWTVMRGGVTQVLRSKITK